MCLLRETGCWPERLGWQENCVTFFRSVKSHLANRAAKDAFRPSSWSWGKFPYRLETPSAVPFNEETIGTSPSIFESKSAAHPVVETLFSSGHKFLPPCRFLSDLTIPNLHESRLSMDFAETVLCGTAVGC